MNRREFLGATGLAAVGNVNFGEGPPVRFEDVQSDQIPGFLDVPSIRVRAHQDPGQVVNWVLPGKRDLSRYTFGTPDSPYNLPDHWINIAEGPVKQLLQKFPIPAGVPLDKRAVNEEGTRFTHTTFPTAFSDKYKTTSGQFDITYIDRQPKDESSPTERGGKGPTRDDVELSSTFTDPSGNEYEIQLTKVVPRPFPNYESGGGVVTLREIHGVTGTGTPLMPRMFTYGAFWGFADLIINGETVDTNRAVHFMTTEMVRDSDYTLTFTPDLPLTEETAYLGHPHHTHGILPPVKLTKNGPVYDPVPTEYQLPGGKKQPFIHIMYDIDVIDEIVIERPNAG